MDFKIRIAQQSDSAELRDLYKNTVLVVNRRDYSQDEVEDWASCGDDLSNIEEMIKTHYFIVAVNQLSQIVGFSIHYAARLSVLYVHSRRLSRQRHCNYAFGRNRTICYYKRYYTNHIRSESNCSSIL